jgi:hypothetical protein
MPVNKGVVIFRGDSGTPKSNYAKTIIEGVTGDGALATLQGVIEGHTKANIAKRAFSTLTTVNDNEPGVGALVDRKAVCYFKDLSNLHVITLTISAPADASCEVIDDGERVTDAAMEDLRAALAAATGKTLTALYGNVIQKV